MSGSSYILIAEDDLTNQAVLQAMLTAFGYKMDVANNGEEAVRMAAARRPSLILMDISMPVKNGIEAAEEIQRHAAAESIGIIAVTANDTRQQREECAVAGFLDFLPKPINMPDLKSMLERYLY